MLVLTRRPATDVLAEFASITITLSDRRTIVVSLQDIIGGSRARIGIEAPADVTIARTELLTTPAPTVKHPPPKPDRGGVESL